MIAIPENYQAAIDKAMAIEGVTVSTLKVKSVMTFLSESEQDFVDAQFWVKQYKRQNKRVSKAKAFIDGIQLAIAELNENDPVRQKVECIIDAYTLKEQPINEDEF